MIALPLKVALVAAGSLAAASVASSLYAKKNGGRMPVALWTALVALPDPVARALLSLSAKNAEEFAKAGAYRSVQLASGSIAAPGEGGR